MKADQTVEGFTTPLNETKQLSLFLLLFFMPSHVTDFNSFLICTIYFSFLLLPRFNFCKMCFCQFTIHFDPICPNTLISNFSGCGRLRVRQAYRNRPRRSQKYYFFSVQLELILDVIG